jgi:endonuclease YncB( thermonuclease family)
MPQGEPSTVVDARSYDRAPQTQAQNPTAIRRSATVPASFSSRPGKTLSAVAALGVLLVVLVLGASAGAATSATQVAVVDSVYDGDTLSLQDGRRVRLLQIDTPELGSGECYSRAARTALLGLAPPGKRIVLETDPALDRVDRYGRLLRYVKRNGVNVNLELVRRGAAAPYFYRGKAGRYAGALMRAALGARAARRGLWRVCPSTDLNPFSAVTTGRTLR